MNAHATSRITIATFALLLASSSFAGRPAAPAEPSGRPSPSSRGQFQYHLFPERLMTDRERTLTACFLQEGPETIEIQSPNEHGVAESLSIGIPVGELDEHLLADASSLACTDPPEGWRCHVDNTDPALAVVRFEPEADFVLVEPEETLCFSLEGALVNPVEGLVRVFLTQEIAHQVVIEPVNDFVKLYKSTEGASSHDDLSDVRPDQHHARHADAEAVAAVRPEFDRLDGRINDEVSDRTAADDALRADLDQETVDRQAGDEALRIDLDQEAASRQAGDDALRADLDAEISERTADVADLRLDVDAHVSADADLDGSNELQTLAYDVSGNLLSLSDGNTVDLSELQDNTDMQALAYDDTTNLLSLTNGGSVDLSDLQDPADADWTVSGNDMTAGVSGKVGIGATNPKGKLQVQGGMQVTENLASGAIVIGEFGNNKTNMGIDENAIQVRKRVHLLFGGWRDRGKTLHLNPEGGEVVVGEDLKVKEDVVIDHKLTVAGRVKLTSGGPAVGKVLTSDASGIATWQDSATISSDGDWTVSGNDMSAGVSGNVGIGTATPSTKLDVSGSASISDGLTVGGTLTLSAGSPAVGKVLTSDATGVATWQDSADADQADGACFNNNADRFHDCGNGTVYDSVSGLICMKEWSCSGAKRWKGGNDWAAALADGQCGLTDGSSAGDWRLPTIEEWRMKTPADVYEELSIVDRGCVEPSIPNTAGTGCWSAGDPFDNVATTGTRYYWSATSNASNPSRAWSVTLYDGSVLSDNKPVTKRVVAVRGGPRSTL